MSQMRSADVRQHRDHDQMGEEEKEGGGSRGQGQLATLSPVTSSL